MSDSKDPVPLGSLAIDCTLLASCAVDLPRGRRGLRASLRGFAEEILEMMPPKAAPGAVTDTTDADFERHVQAVQHLGQLEAALPAARRLVKLLEKTRAVIDEELQREVQTLVQGVDNRAKLDRSEQLLRKFVKTRAHRKAAGVKAAARARKKKAEPRAGSQTPEVKTHASK
jgi:hypothetical protein